MLNIFILTALIALGSAAQAMEKTDWKKNYTGLDGISAQCELTTSRSYAGEICKRITATAKADADAKWIKFFFAGKASDTGSGAGRTAIQPGRPLLLHILIKGTPDKTPGASVSMQLYLDYTNAVQQGDPSNHPRSGKLVFWRKDLIGTGPAKRLSAAMISVMSKELRSVISDIAASTQKGQNGKQ
jgi:hypothetical protein